MLEIEGESYYDAAEAARELKCSPRQVQRYAESGRLPRRRLGRKDYYPVRLVEMLADDLGVDKLPAIPGPPEIVPSNELMLRVDGLIGRLDQLSAALVEAEARARAAEAQLRLLPPPEEAARLRDERDGARVELAATKAERDALRAELSALRAPRPWYTLPAVWLGIFLLVALVAVVILALMR